MSQRLEKAALARESSAYYITLEAFIREDFFGEVQLLPLPLPPGSVQDWDTGAR